MKAHWSPRLKSRTLLGTELLQLQGDHLRLLHLSLLLPLLLLRSQSREQSSFGSKDARFSLFDRPHLLYRGLLPPAAMWPRTLALHFGAGNRRPAPAVLRRAPQLLWGTSHRMPSCSERPTCASTLYVNALHRAPHLQDCSYMCLRWWHVHHPRLALATRPLANLDLQCRLLPHMLLRFRALVG